MRSHDHSDRILRRIAEEIEEQIDCTACANCCRVATAIVTGRDAERLARLPPDTLQGSFSKRHQPRRQREK